MEQGKFLPLLIICVQTAEGFIWNSNTTSNYVCVGDNIPLPWVYTLELGEILQLTSWTKSDGAGGSIFLADDLGGFTPATGYVGRLTSIGIAGIQISNATSSDTGTYTVIVALTSGTEHRMNATVHVHEIAKASCIPTCDKSLNCQIPQACPVQKYIDVVKYPNGFQCSLDNNNKPYSVCAEGDAVTLCYNGSSLCRNDTCIEKPKCERELGLGLGLGLGIPCVITGIIVVIFIYTAYAYPYYLGLVLGLGIGITFQVGWIIIASLISTGNECKLELGLGLGLGSGLPDGIAYIVSVIFVFFVFSLFIGIPKRVELGKGILTGLLFASVIGIIVVYLIYHKLKREPTSPTHEDNPPETDDEKPKPKKGQNPEHVPLDQTDKKSKTNNSGSSSAVSREHVRVQMENKGVKDVDEERPPTVHTKSQNKVEPNTISEQTNYRQQPLPPVDTEFEDTPYRRLPQPPQNGEIKDRNLRGISATIDDTPGLANETPRSKLPPLTIEPKKKRKKRQKKDQMNEETPEEETILRVN